MRLERCKSYGDLTRGQDECWKIFSKSEQQCEAITNAMIAENLHIAVADFVGQDDDGFSSEFIVDKIHVEEFKAAFKALKTAKAKPCQQSVSSTKRSHAIADATDQIRGTSDHTSESSQKCQKQRAHAQCHTRQSQSE